MATSKRRIVPMAEMIGSAQQQRFEDRIELQEAIRCLDQDHRIVIHLYYNEDLPVKDIAAILEMQEGTVKSRLSRARHRLSEVLSENHVEGGHAHERI